MIISRLSTNSSEVGMGDLPPVGRIARRACRCWNIVDYSMPKSLISHAALRSQLRLVKRSSRQRRRAAIPYVRRARSGPYCRREKGRTATTQGTQERDASRVVNGEMRDGQMVLAGALVLLVIGTVLFHFLSPWWLTPIASNWDTIDETMHVTFWVTGVVF